MAIPIAKTVRIGDWIVGIQRLTATSTAWKLGLKMVTSRKASKKHYAD